MTQMTTPPPTIPEQGAVYRNSKYQRRRNPLSLVALIIGLLIGLAGGWYYAYIINPVQETSTRPDQLRDDDLENYVVAIMLAYSYDGDLIQAYDRLVPLNLGLDPVQAVADMACDLAVTGYVDSTSGLRAVRAMRTFYQSQGRTGCADNIIPDSQTVPLEVTIVVPTATPTLPPPPTKTPGAEEITSTPNSDVVVVPTTAPQRTYDGFIIQTYCDELLSGIIEIRVRDGFGDEVAGEPLRVQWGENQSDFVTGLKPERGIGYADFQMEFGLSYIVSMPGLSDPLPNPIVATTCTDPNTLNEAVTSYVVIFTRN